LSSLLGHPDLFVRDKKARSEGRPASAGGAE